MRDRVSKLITNLKQLRGFAESKARNMDLPYARRERATGYINAYDYCIKSLEEALVQDGERKKRLAKQKAKLMRANNEEKRLV